MPSVPEPPALPELPAFDFSNVSMGAWDTYFNEPAPLEGGINWDAYSHEELYQMLHKDADVADVSTVAAEWAEHRSALTNHAAVLREQKTALLESWEGSGAEEAARRLDVLADRVEKLAEFAAAGEQAAQDAADALAQARAKMPPPPGESGTAGAPVADAATNWTDLMSGTSGPTGTTGTSGASSGTTSSSASGTSSTSTAFGAVGSAGFSFYTGAGGAESQKAQAVRAMQGYETNLAGSSQLIGEARGTIPAASTIPSGARDAATKAGDAGAAPDSGQGSGQGRPRSGQGLAAGVAMGAGIGAAAGGAGYAAMRMGGGLNQLAQGMRVGAGMFGPGSMTPAQLAAAEAAAARSAGAGAMVPPGGQRGGDSEEAHENQLPTIDHELFPMDEPDSLPVLGMDGDDQ